MRALALLLLVGCAEIPGEPIPAGVVALALELWPYDAPECAPPRWGVVSPEEFNERCPIPTCATENRPGYRCALSCTINIPEDPVALYAGPPAPWFYQVPVAETQIHETYHVWLKCTLGDVDLRHQDPVWTETMAEVHLELTSCADQDQCM